MLTCRKAEEADVLLYYEWTNDAEVRKQSFQSGEISLEDHKDWFYKKIHDDNCLMLLFENENKEAIGQVRFQKEDNEGYVIGISVAAASRNKGFAAKLLLMASDYFLQQFPAQKIYAYIKETNTGSVRSFKNAGFIFSNELIIAGNKSVLYTKTNNNENR